MTPKISHAAADHQRFSATQRAVRIIEAARSILNCPFFPAVNDAGKASTVTKQKRLAVVASLWKKRHILQIAQPKSPMAKAR